MKRMKSKKNKFSYWVVAIVVGLPLMFLLSNCSKDRALATAQSVLAGKSNGQTLSVDYHVVWSSIVDSNTARINRALSSNSITKVILDYRSGGWTCDTIFMHKANKTLWIAGSGSNPGHLIASGVGEIFHNPTANFIKMLAAGCVLNGYSNGVDTTQGRATIEMFKSTYGSSSSRDAVRPGVDNGVVEGVIIKNAGEDGIYMASGNGVTILDVIVDGASRNGMSIAKGVNTTVTNCVFKNTSGASPEDGMDIEPRNSTDTLSNIVVTNCVFANNNGTNLVIQLKNVTPNSPTFSNTLYFYGCTTAGGAKHGIQISNASNTGPALGEVYFQKCHFNYPTYSAIYVKNWCTGRMKIDFNKCTIYNAGASSAGNASPPIYVDSDTSSHYNVGHINFVGVTNRIDDFNSAHPYIIGGVAASQAFDSITGTAADVTIQRHYSSGAPILSFTPHAGYTNTNITLAYTLVP
jgi:hypothetical protein